MPDSTASHVLDLLVRRERGRLIAGLVNRFGNHNLDLAEDVAQDALLTALTNWPYRGIPDNPAGWLARVAANKAIDRLRRKNKEQLYAVDVHDATGATLDEASVYQARINDPELQLMFLACHAELEGVDQLVLTLRIVGGFTAREIAGIFLSTETAIAQRLSRSKRKLKHLDAQSVSAPTAFEIASRLDAVLKVVYLMFSLGYAPRNGARLIRRDVALEALRLARNLAGYQLTSTTTCKALAALLCFQASRFDARETADGAPVLLSRQNFETWDRSLIDDGLRFLQEAMTGEAVSEAVSRYHLEAGIAACYAIAPSWERIDWQAILRNYERLEQIIDSPVVTINGCVARAFAGAPAQALTHLEQLAPLPILAAYAPYHIAKAEVLRLLHRNGESIASYRRAIQSGASVPVLQHLEQRLATNL